VNRPGSPPPATCRNCWRILGGPGGPWGT
jgi:hypothetical protein